MLGILLKSRVYSAAISRDVTIIVAGESDGMVRRWIASTGEAMGEPTDGHSRALKAVVISDDGKLIITGSDDRTIRRWDARTGDGIGNPMDGH